MRPYFEIFSIDESSVIQLQDISIATFRETFAHSNTEADMQDYCNTNLCTEQLLKELNNKESFFYLAKENEKICGYLKLNIGAAQTEVQPENNIEIERIYVLKEMHGTGLGYKLMNHAYSIAKQLYKNTIWLGVWEHNTQAIDFYHRQQFEVFGEHHFVLGQDVQRDVLMQRQLT